MENNVPSITEQIKEWTDDLKNHKIPITDTYQFIETMKRKENDYVLEIQRRPPITTSKNIDTKELVKKLSSNFNDYTLMRLMMDQVKSIIWQNPKKPEENINRIHENLSLPERLGVKSAYGDAFKLSLKKTHSTLYNYDFAVIKKAKNKREDYNTVHEAAVGYSLNKMRKYVLNYSFVYGTLECSDVTEENNKTTGWCHHTPNNEVNYVIYENIDNNGSFESYFTVKPDYNSYLTKAKVYRERWSGRAIYDKLNDLIYKAERPGKDLQANAELLDHVNYVNAAETIMALAQIYLALREGYLRLNFSHNDLHLGNILMRKYTNYPVHMKYTVDGSPIYLLSPGSVATIIDYGRSQVDGFFPPDTYLLKKGFEPDKSGIMRDVLTVTLNTLGVGSNNYAYLHPLLEPFFGLNNVPFKDFDTAWYDLWKNIYYIPESVISRIAPDGDPAKFIDLMILKLETIYKTHKMDVYFGKLFENERPAVNVLEPVLIKEGKTFRDYLLEFQDTGFVTFGDLAWNEDIEGKLKSRFFEQIDKTFKFEELNNVQFTRRPVRVDYRNSAINYAEKLIRVNNDALEAIRYIKEYKYVKDNLQLPDSDYLRRVDEMHINMWNYLVSAKESLDLNYPNIHYLSLPKNIKDEATNLYATLIKEFSQLSSN